jgi:hypothetical protein
MGWQSTLPACSVVLLSRARSVTPRLEPSRSVQSGARRRSIRIRRTRTRAARTRSSRSSGASPQVASGQCAAERGSGREPRARRVRRVRGSGGHPASNSERFDRAHGSSVPDYHGPRLWRRLHEPRSLRGHAACGVSLFDFRDGHRLGSRAHRERRSAARARRRLAGRCAAE